MAQWSILSPYHYCLSTCSLQLKFISYWNFHCFWNTSESIKNRMQIFHFIPFWKFITQTKRSLMKIMNRIWNYLSKLMMDVLIHQLQLLFLVRFLKCNWNLSIVPLRYFSLIMNPFYLPLFCRVSGSRQKFPDYICFVEGCFCAVLNTTDHLFIFYNSWNQSDYA